MRTLVISCVGLMLLSTIAAEMQYDKEELMNFISNLLNTDGEDGGPVAVDENTEVGDDTKLLYPMAKRGSKMTQEICRRECSSCSKVMNILFMSCWRDCQLSNAGRSNLMAWSTCRRFLIGWFHLWRRLLSMLRYCFDLTVFRPPVQGTSNKNINAYVAKIVMLPIFGSS